jgi:hypothetical protein
MVCLTLFEGLFELRWALFVVVQAGFLFNIDAEQRGEDRILVVQQPARVGVLTSVLEQPVEPWLVVTP